MTHSEEKGFVISLCEENTISRSTDAYLCLLLGTVNEQYHHGNHDYPFSQVILHGPSTSTRNKNFNFLFVTKKWRFCSFLVLYSIFIQANFSEWRTDILSYSSCNCHDGKSPWVWKWCARILSKFLVLRRRVPLKGRVFLSPPFLTTPLPLPLLLSYQTVRFLSNEVKTVRVPIYYAPTGGRFPPATERMNDLAVLVSSNEWSLQYTKSYNYLQVP